MFLFIGSVAYGQDLISVEVNTDKLVEFIEKKDKEIRLLKKHVSSIKATLYASKEVNGLLISKIDSLSYYKLYYDHSKHVIGPRVIKKIELMIKPE